MEHGRAGSKEVLGASQWLADNGMLPTTTAAASSDDDESVFGVLEGRSDWPDLDPDRILPRLQLEGVGTPTQGIGFTRLSDMPVTVGEKTMLDLTQDNAAAAKDVFKRKS